jgi:hypothetical protein
VIDADDLAQLAVSFEAAMRQTRDGAAVDAALFELGWADVLDTSDRQAAAMAFTALGSTGAAASLLDDVVAHALGREVESTVCVVVPAPHQFQPAGLRRDGDIHFNGLVSARIDHADRALLPVAEDGIVRFYDVDAATLRSESLRALDPARPYRRVSGQVSVTDSAVSASGTWAEATRDAQLALAYQLIAAARAMLELGRQHALDRVQFGRSVASFQAVRHKLAEVLVAIEGAAAVAEACIADQCDPLLAALAKSLAGRAARLAATNVQQVLAGIGFTTDHPFHLLLKRTMVIDTIFGSARSLPTDIGRELLTRRNAPRLVNL